MIKLADSVYTVVKIDVLSFVRFTVIMQTCPFNVDPLTHHFYIVKLGSTGVYIIFLVLL